MYFQIEWTYKVLSTMDKIKVHTMKFQNIGNKEKIIQFGERGKKKKTGITPKSSFKTLLGVSKAFR